MYTIEAVKAAIKDALDKRAANETEAAGILAAAEADEKRSLTEAEDSRFAELLDERSALDSTLDELRQRLDQLESDARSREAAEETRKRLGVNTTTVQVGTEERTYRPDGDHDFIADAYRAKMHGDVEARQRTERARAEALAEYRSTTGNFGGLVVPQYLTAQFAEVLRSGRPFLNSVTSVPLPEAGMTMTIPRGATGTLVAAQETQNTAVSNQTYTESDLVVPVRTFAGQQVVSRQAVERGTGIGPILLQDLYASYATRTNVSALGGDGTAGGHWGVLNTTSIQTAAWTGTTGASLVSAIHNAIGKINAARYMPADLIVMHPRRWAWLCAQSDSNGRPLVEINGYTGDNVVGAGAAAGYGAVGSIAGLPVVIDAGVPTGLGASTDEDRIIVTRRADNLFMEDGGAPVGFNFEEVLGDQLSIRMVVFGYSAFTAGRYPVATCALQGTGFKQVLS